MPVLEQFDLPLEGRHLRALAACLAKCTVVVYALCSYPAFAVDTDADADFMNGELDQNTPKISWMPGERYDSFKGTMNYSSIDLSIPGNGKLPIEIKRVFNQTGRVSGRYFSPAKGKVVGGGNAFGNMNLATPRLTFERNTGRFDGCINRGFVPSATDGAAGTNFIEVGESDDETQFKPHERGLETPMIFTDGDREISFYEVTDGNRRFAQSDVLPDMDFVSTSNWGIKCLDGNSSSTSNIETVGFYSASLLNVYSPDGIVYRMRGNTMVNRNSERRIMSTYAIERVEDAYGNSLTYKYKMMPKVGERTGKVGIRQSLVSIVASDGREVNIGYEPAPFLNSSGKREFDVWRIASVTGNGSPKPRSVRYEYGNNYLKVIENEYSTREYDISDGRINSITYPTGSKITYVYGQDFAIANTKYKMLATRISQPDNEVIRFEHHPDPIDPKVYSRIIRKPSSATEYRYRVSSATRYNKPKPYNVSSGKLIRYKVFDDPEVIWSPSTLESVLLERSYRYKSLYKIADLVRQDADRIVLERVVSKMTPSGSSYRSVFNTEYPYYDSRGYPTRIIERTGNPNPDKFRATNISYQHDGFDGWILGKPTVVDIDGIDTTETKYNVKGDVRLVNKNAKVVHEYDWYMSGANAGEIRTHTNGQGGITTYSNYLRGEAQNILNPTGRYQQIDVNTDGTIRSKTRFGDTTPTTYTYDALRRLATVDSARPGAAIQRFVWSDSNRRRSEVDRGVIVLDHYGRKIVEAGFDRVQGRTVSRKYAYDAEGRLIFESHPLDLTVSEALQASMPDGQKMAGSRYQYDGLGRLKNAIHSAREGRSNTTYYRYKVASNGNQAIEQTDGRGLITTTEYVSYGMPNYQWPVSVKEADGTQSTIERNSIGNVLSHTRGGVTTSYGYNAQNLVSTMTRLGDSLTTFDYYDDGLLKHRSNNGHTASYYYFPDLKIQQEDHIDTDENKWVKREYLYDRNGNLEHMLTHSEDGLQNNKLSYTYDEEDNLKTEALEVDGVTLGLTYQYDKWSNRSTIVYPSGNYYELGPNAFGDPTFIKQANGENKVIYDRIEYHPDNSAKLLRRNGHQVTTTIDSGQRPWLFQLEEYGAGVNRRLDSREFSYDRANNVSKINDTVNVQTSLFGYDKRNRLTLANISGADNWEFSYLDSDDIDWVKHGSSTSSYVYEETTRRLRKVEQDGVARRFEYDKQGNTIRHDRITESGGVARMNIKFNAANQVVKMSDGTKFAYDARGLRVKKDLNGPIYSFYDSAKKLIFRKDVGAGVTSEYFYVGGKLVARRDVDQSGGAQAGSEAPVAAAPSETVAPTQSTDERPPVPATLWPANDGVGSTPEYIWTAVPGATRYEIVTREPDTNEQWVYEQLSASQTGCSQGEEKCRFTKEDSSLSGAKRWAVRSENAAGFSQWSEWRHFSVRN